MTRLMPAPHATGNHLTWALVIGTPVLGLLLLGLYMRVLRRNEGAIRTWLSTIIIIITHMQVPHRTLSTARDPPLRGTRRGT